MAKTTTKDDGPQHLQVKTSFQTAIKGVTHLYREGEPVRADDPIARKYPEHFEPLVFPHDTDLGQPAPVEPEPEPEPEVDPLSRQQRSGAANVPESEEG